MSEGLGGVGGWGVGWWGGGGGVNVCVYVCGWNEDNVYVSVCG